MKLPGALLHSLEDVAGFDKEAFVRVHEEARPPVSIRINPTKWTGDKNLSTKEDSFVTAPDNCSVSIHPSQKVPWCSTGYYLPSRPSFTFDPLFHAGCYYVQEASSMVLEQPFKQLLDLSQPLKVLDLCAAPGGKSTHIQSLLSTGSLLVSNEVIKPRSIVLTDNIIRWGCKNVLVTNNDPRAFQNLPGFFDVMVVDAPCSGSGLFRKDEDAIEEWSLHNVELCSQRQQRILADALPALKEDGLLIYSTCSYSVEEDEKIMNWLVDEMEMENVPLQMDSFDGVIITRSDSGSEGYRFYPDKIKGEGFFMACFRKKRNDIAGKLKPFKAQVISAKEKKIISNWVIPDELEFVYFRNDIVALQVAIFQDFLLLQNSLNVVYAGVALGEVLKEDLVPHHALAQNSILAETIPAIELSYDQAIKYLQKQEPKIEPSTNGWQIVRYQHHSLGWIKALKNRINNYYPKEIRILKSHNTTSFEK